MPNPKVVHQENPSRDIHFRNLVVPITRTSNDSTATLEVFVEYIATVTDGKDDPEVTIINHKVHGFGIDVSDKLTMKELALIEEEVQKDLEEVL
jgi:hypothetical protein